MSRDALPEQPGDVLVCLVTRANRGLLDKWKAVPDSLLYPSAASTRSAAALLEPAGHAAIPAGSSPLPAK